MQNNTLCEMNQLQQYSHVVDTYRKRTERHLKEMFCLLFPNRELILKVQKQGLPDVLFVNPDDFYCLNDTLGRSYKLIPLDTLEKGNVIFNWNKKHGEIQHQETAVDLAGIRQYLY